MASKNIPVNGWPQLKDLEAAQPILNRLDKIEDWKRTVKEETFTGEEITIPNALALPARSLITTIEAIQDLHGQSAPYVGGAGKNKLPMTVSGIKAANTGGSWSGNVYTVNGGTITIVTDDGGNVTGIKANGTFNADTRFIFTANSGIGSGSYVLNGCPSGGSDATYRIFVGYYQTEGGQLYGSADIGSGRTYNNIYSIVDVRIDIMANNTLSDVVFYPMIRLSTESDPAFAPYSNLCPISGRTAAVLTRSDGDEISEDFTIQLGTTVYGADINWDTGVMTVLWAAETFDGSNDENWELSSSGKRVYTNNLASVIKAPASGGIVANIISNEFKATSENDTYAGNIGVSVDTTGLLGVSDGTGSMSPSAFKTWLTSNPLQVCYELATPTTIQLTPEQLQMLKGYNRITLSDGYGTIELKALTGANWS